MTGFGRIAIAAQLIGTVAFATVALAQQHGGHGAHQGASPPVATSPSTAGYKAANEKMHKEMDIAFSGDADADFVRSMIPHHQGAIEMAKVMLANGKDPELKKLARSIIAEQEKEIGRMRAWLARNGR